MKKEEILRLVLIFLFSFILVGCKSTTLNDKKYTDKQITSNEENKNDNKVDDNVSSIDNTNENKRENINSSNDSIENKAKDTPSEKFFGKWIICKDLTSASQITTYDANDIKSIIGKSLSFSNEKATAFGESPQDLNNIIEDPVYKRTIISKKEFEDLWGITFKDLGINEDSVTEIKVSSSKSQSTCDFLIKDDNTLILYGGGVFLQVKK